MILRADNLWTQVLEAPGGAGEALWTYLAATSPGYWFTEAYKRGFWDGKVHLYEKKEARFPTGLLRMALGHLRGMGFEPRVEDARRRPKTTSDFAKIEWLRPYQRAALADLVVRTRGIVQAPPGAGKCLGRGTMVRMFDGAQKGVEDVVVGDRLMGPDSRPRTVMSVSRGSGPLRLIEPVKGEPWVCNDVHVLTLVNSGTGEVIDVDLCEYESWAPTRRRQWKLFTVGVDFEQGPEPLTVDPYFLGVWLGDGRKDMRAGRAQVSVSKPDVEIEECCREEAARWGLELRVEDSGDRCKTYRIVKGKMGPSENPLMGALRELCSVPGRREVPRRYLVGPREVRAQVLAGLLDTDGYHDGRGGFQFSQKPRWVTEQVAFLARSLGLRATVSPKEVPGYGTYWLANISGHTDRIPTRIPRKKAPPRRQKKDVTRTGFRVLPAGDGDYFGFTLDGDGRFLLADFTVTHNTEMFVAGGNLLEIPWLILVDTRDLMEQAAARFRSRTGTLAGMVGDGVWRELRWTVAMVQTIDAQLDEPRTQAMLGRVQGLVFDECHLAAGDRNMKILMSCPEAYYRWGFSATPTGRKDGMDLKAFGALGPVCHRIREQELVEAGAIAAAKVRFVAHEHEHSVLSGSWTDIESTNIVGSDSRNALVVDMVRRAARPTLVHARRLPHIRRLVALIRSAGLRVDFVQGDTGDRAGRVRRLEHRDLDVLVVSKVFNKGIDIPEARSLVNAAGGDSAIDAVQLLGRPGRATAEKTECEYWDVMDRGDKTLARHAKHRLAALQARGWPCEVLDDVAAPVQGSIPLGPVGG